MSRRAGLAFLLGASCQPGSSTEEGSSAPSARLEVDAVVFVGAAVSFDAGESVGARFVWDFGDGTGAEGASVAHAYAAPGRHTVRLTAESEDGRTDTANATWVAVYEPLPTMPASGGRLARLNSTLYAAIPDSDEVVVVRDGGVVDRLAVCGHPVSVSAAARGEGGVLAVACRDDAVQLWDTTSHALLAEHPLRWGARPIGVAVDADAVWVTLAGTGELLRWSEAGATTTPVADPRAVAVADGVAYVTRFRSPDLGGITYRIDSAAVTDFALAPDLGPDSDTDARGVPTLLGAVAVSPDGRGVVIGGAKANVARGVARDGLALTHETSTRAALRLVDAITGSWVERALFDNRDAVGAVAFTPLGDRLLVAHQGAGVVDVLDPVTMARLGGFQDVGVGLDGIATDGLTAWVLASWDRELVAYDFSAGNGEIELARISLVELEPLDSQLLLGARVFHDAGDPRMSRDAYLSCASCHPEGGQDGRTWDFTNRGEGFRDTQALFALPDAGPFHWTANFDELQDFEGAIRADQAGTGFLSDADFAAHPDALGLPRAGLSAELDALAAYMRSFAPPRSPWREADGLPTAAGERGRAVFAAEACAACHAGAEMTDAGWIDTEGAEERSPVLHDVGTLLETSGARIGAPLTGLRTPSLHGLFATAPYLHDGRAATLADALGGHGIALSVADEADLVAYLLEIEGSP